ncbi:MAG: saccharopine dehydrogenase [Elusimicrobia bacterium RIFOXYB2_FULL_49_7]|nr:MAG: saccharopine dehydrogenase [Elusimicrobia bacterium RIFOXYB2_FULL_49_7]
MNRVLIIGAGGVGNVVVKKCAQIPEVFSDIILASRTLPKCRIIQQEVPSKKPIRIAKVDADNPREMADLLRRFRPNLVINVALPYQDLPIMEACLQTGTHYLDTANYEPKNVAKFEYKWQWAYRKRFREKGIMALLGSGFDPGVTNVFCAYAQKHYFDTIETVDILDCNAGSHGHPFATNFNPEINIREITQKGKYWKNGKWIEIPPLSRHFLFRYPKIGAKESYLLYHEELESLVKHLKGLKQIRFWMTFGEAYLNHLRVLQNVGMTRIDPIEFEGNKIVPLQFLKAVLPDPGSLGVSYHGKTNIGCLFKGRKSGKDRSLYLYNICDHTKCYQEVQAQAVSYTTGVPAVIGAMMILQKKWFKPGVWNMEQFNPDPFMKELSARGLPWIVEQNKEWKIPD